VYPERNRVAGSVAKRPPSGTVAPASAWYPKAIGAEFAHNHVGRAKGKKIKVAVLDSGVDCNHPCFSSPSRATILAGFKPALWPGSCEPFRDPNGHGTMAAGVIAGGPLNDLGLLPGVAEGAEIVSVLIARPSGCVHLVDLIAGLKALKGAGIPIAYVGVSRFGRSANVLDAIRDLKAETLIVAAAGNFSSSVEDFLPDWPILWQDCAAEANFVLAGAVDRFASREGASCFGKSSIHLLAPGVGIAALVPGGGATGQFGRTSAAAAIVAGTAALAWAGKNNQTPAKVKQDLLAGGKDHNEVRAKLSSSGVAHAAAAVGVGAPVPWLNLPTPSAPVPIAIPIKIDPQAGTPAQTKDVPQAPIANAKRIRVQITVAKAGWNYGVILQGKGPGARQKEVIRGRTPANGKVWSRWFNGNQITMHSVFSKSFACEAEVDAYEVE
jgi:subtilisin family serine protease